MKRQIISPKAKNAFKHVSPYTSEEVILSEKDIVRLAKEYLSLDEDSKNPVSLAITIASALKCPIDKIPVNIHQAFQEMVELMATNHQYHDH